MSTNTPLLADDDLDTVLQWPPDPNDDDIDVFEMPQAQPGPSVGNSVHPFKLVRLDAAADPPGAASALSDHHAQAQAHTSGDELPEELVSPMERNASGKPTRTARPAWLRLDRIGFVVLAALAAVQSMYIGYRYVRPSLGEPAAVSASRVTPQPTTTGSAAEAQKAAAVPIAVGQLTVESDPSGAQVSVDGTVRGPAPITVANLTPGSHAVVLQNAAGSVKRPVTIRAGAFTSLVVPMPAPSAGSGWVRISSPIELQVREGDRLLGTSRVDRLMLPSGRHTFALVNDATGYQTKATVDVAPGKVAGIQIKVPNGRLSVNASPWAEVFVDGTSRGETPLANLELPAGTHEVTLRHPSLGEATRNVVVRIGEPTRVSVDLRK